MIIQYFDDSEASADAAIEASDNASLVDVTIDTIDRCIDDDDIATLNTIVNTLANAIIAANTNDDPSLNAAINDASDASAIAQRTLADTAKALALRFDR